MAPVVLTHIILTKFVTFESSLSPPFFADLGKIRHTRVDPQSLLTCHVGWFILLHLGAKEKSSIKKGS